MKKAVVMFILILGVLRTYAAESWLSYDEGLAKGKAENKGILVDFYTDWCHWCKVMDQKTFGDQAVAAKLKSRFITVRLNAEDETQTATVDGQTYNNVQLTRAYGVTGFPSLAFLEPDGDVITVIPGYVPPETFIHILDYIDQRLYEQKMPFEEFLKKQQEKKKSKR